jgi:hypothetical protein
MTPLKRILVWGVAVAAASACTTPRRGPAVPSRPDGRTPAMSEREQNIRLMLSFDGNSDSTVTRAEMEVALKRQFDACDTNHDGRIDLREMQAENDRRFRAFGSSASPLIDWNQDGQIDFDEFAATARLVFAELDTNHDGQLDRDELRIAVPNRGVARPSGGTGGRRGRGQGAPPGGLAPLTIGQ